MQPAEIDSLGLTRALTRTVPRPCGKSALTLLAFLIFAHFKKKFPRIFVL